MRTAPIFNKSVADWVVTIEYLKVVKDSSLKEKDWWHELTVSQKEAIERGLKDIEEGRVVSHEDVKKKYGL
jgi:ribosomal protein S25